MSDFGLFKLIQWLASGFFFSKFLVLLIIFQISILISVLKQQTDFIFMNVLQIQPPKICFQHVFPLPVSSKICGIYKAVNQKPEGKFPTYIQNVLILVPSTQVKTKEQHFPPKKKKSVNIDLGNQRHEATTNICLYIAMLLINRKPIILTIRR